MALDPINLDDLTWDDLVQVARRRIPSASQQRWTLHAPVDPGITLTELFAWLLEQRLYWMNQVPDGMLHGALALLGERSRPARAARTVVQFEPDQSTTLPAATLLRLRGNRGDPIIFSTNDDVALLRSTSALRIEVDGVDRTTDLGNRRGVAVFSTDGSAREVKLWLMLSEPLPAVPPAAPIGIFFELLQPAQVPPPQWHPEAAQDVLPPAKITWSYRSASAAEPIPWIGGVDDGTGGLRRSGIVRLPIPHDWSAEPVSPTVPENSYFIWMRVERGTFTYPPRVRRVELNAVIARHARRTKVHELRLDWLPIAGSTLSLASLSSEAGDAEHPVIEDSVELTFVERREGRQWWRRVTSLDFSGPADRVFEVDRSEGVLRFGDGLVGRVPSLAPPSEENAIVQFEVGGGQVGNVGPELGWEVPGSALQAKNLVAGVGGAETEAVAAARDRLGGVLLTRRDRAVTPEDFQAIATTVPGKKHADVFGGVAIKRAHAAVGWHPAFPCVVVPGAVTVFIVPHAPRGDDDFDRDDFIAAPVPDPGALDAVRFALDRARLIGAEVFVAGPRYRPIALNVHLRSLAPASSTLRDALRRRFQRFLDALIGGETESGWPFGGPIVPATLMRVAQQEVGDRGEVESVGVRMLDSGGDEESCKETVIRAHELPLLAELAVQVRHAQSATGGLR